MNTLGDCRRSMPCLASERSEPSLELRALTSIARSRSLATPRALPLPAQFVSRDLFLPPFPSDHPQRQNSSSDSCTSIAYIARAHHVLPQVREVSRLGKLLPPFRAGWLGCTDLLTLQPSLGQLHSPWTARVPALHEHLLHHRDWKRWIPGSVRLLDRRLEMAASEGRPG